MTTTCALPPAPRALQAGGAGMYFQNYNPAGNVFLSTLLAAVPILVLLYFIALHPHRDKRGIRRLGVAAPYAAFYGVLAAFLVSCLVFRMPIVSAVSALVGREDVEIHQLVLRKAAKAFPLDRRVVNEHIGRAVLGRDETIALLIIEPLHFASNCHVVL